MPYVGTATQHRWTVEVIRRTDNTVFFRVLKGPGSKKKRVFHLSATVFARNYKEV